MLLITIDQSYYELLEISSEASPLEIKRAFKRLARKYHPDMVVTSTDDELKLHAESQMKLLNRAKEILLDPKLKAKYDYKLDKKKHEIEWSTDYETSNEVVTTLGRMDIDWEEPDANDYFSFESQTEVNDNDYQQGELDFDGLNNGKQVIHNPPHSYTSPEHYNPYGQSAQSTIQKPNKPPLSSAFEVAPGVLFLQKCITCGKLNTEGSAYCTDCKNSLIYDNHPLFYNQAQESDVKSESVPIKPGYRPKSRQSVIVISTCFRCGTLNLNNRPYCMTCKSNLIYYRRPLPKELFYDDDKDKNREHYTSSIYSRTINCPRCGAPNENGRGHCYSCFVRLDLNEPFGYGDQALEYHSITNQNRQNMNRSGSRICPNCGKVTSNNREFCLRCNTRLIYDQPPITINKENVQSTAPTYSHQIGPIDCPHCGAENLPNDEICGSCYKNLLSRGAKLPEQLSVEEKLRRMRERRVRYFGYKPCPQCRVDNDIRAEFCRDCGFEFNHN